MSMLPSLSFLIFISTLQFSLCQGINWVLLTSSELSITELPFDVSGVFSNIRSAGSGEWGSWSAWVRERQCLTGDCLGNDTQTEDHWPDCNYFQLLDLSNLCILFISSELWTLEWLGILSRLLLLPDTDQGVYRDLWWRWDREFSELGPNRHVIRPLEPLELLELLQSLLWWVSLQDSSLHQRRLYHWYLGMFRRGFRGAILLWS